MLFGIFQLLDWICLDVALDVCNYLEGALGEEYGAPEPLKLMVEQGCLGQKTGDGFYKKKVYLI